MLKTSVVVIVAKQFSLIAAHNSFQTICLEEPNEVMHHHIIERIKEVLNDEISSKAIIIITINPYFLDFMPLEKAFISFSIE